MLSNSWCYINCTNAAYKFTVISLNPLYVTISSPQMFCYFTRAILKWCFSLWAQSILLSPWQGVQSDISLNTAWSTVRTYTLGLNTYRWVANVNFSPGNHVLLQNAINSLLLNAKTEKIVKYIATLFIGFWIRGIWIDTSFNWLCRSKLLLFSIL